MSQHNAMSKGHVVPAAQPDDKTNVACCVKVPRLAATDKKGLNILQIAG